MKKYGIALIVSVLLSFLVVSITLLSIPDVSISQDSLDSAKSVLSSVTLTPVNAEIGRHREFKVSDIDPQLYINGIDDEIGAVVVRLRKPLPNGTQYQLYYVTQGSNFSEGNSISKIAHGDSEVLAFRLPEFRRYELLRLDIDSDCQINDLAVISNRESLSTKENGLTLALRDWSKFPCQQFLLCLIILLCESMLIAWKIDSIRCGLKNVRRRIRENKSLLCHSIVTCLICVGIGILAWMAIYKMDLFHLRQIVSLFCFAWIGFCVGLLIVLRRQFELSPERGFLVIALCVGLLFAVVEPPALVMSYDDGVHYRNIVRLSYGNADYITHPERVVSMGGTSNTLSVENRLSSSYYIDSMPFKGVGDDNTVGSLSVQSITAYLPAAGAIWLTRTLGLPASSTVVAGRLGNLLCYVIVAYFAIRQLKYGKLFTSLLCLLPAVLFLAGNFSYDPPVIAYTLLGICIWLGVYQRPESKMTGLKAAVMLASFILGMLVKAVYFPFMLITLFLPESRFNSKRAARRYRWAVILTAVALAASFAIPFMLSGGSADGYNDLRGGSDIDAGAQVVYILQNPAQYFNTLMTFLFTSYFNLANMLSPSIGSIRGFYVFISDQGAAFSDLPTYALLCLIFIAWLISFDAYNRRKEGVPLWLKGVACIVALGTLCIAATSLYCAFTPVGSNWINGFQERYMLPVMIPLLVIIRPAFIMKRAPRFRQLNAVVIFAETAVMIAGMWPFVRCFL